MDTKRYELSDGSSNKFWQIARDGASLVVTFGKIGTNGQAQRKDLASENAAIAEHDKLVKEKTKKGYVAVAGKAATGPAPVPKVKTKTETTTPKPAAAAPPVAPQAPAPAATAPAFQGDYVLEERYVGPRGALTDGSFAALAAAWFPPGSTSSVASYASQLGAGRKATIAKLRSAVDELVALLGANGKGDLGVDASAILLAAAPPDASVPFLVARFGIEHAILAYLASSSVNPIADGQTVNVGAATNYQRPELARALAACEPRVKAPAWKTAVAALRAARDKEKKHRGSRAEYNIVLRDDALFAEDLAANRAAQDWSVTRALFFTTRDPALQRELAVDVSADEVFAVMGLDAQSIVLPMIENDNFIIHTLVDVESVAAARTIANDLKNKRTHADVNAYYAKRPDLALRALVPILVAGGKLAPFVKPVVEATIAAHPKLPAIVAPLLDPKSRAFLVADKKPALPEAAANAIPAALRSDATAGVDGYPKKLAPLPDYAVAAIGAAPVRLQGTETVLSASAMTRLVQAIRYVKDSPLVAAAKSATVPRDLAVFGWELFERWQAAGAPNKEPWGFTALGLLGDDESARKLTPFVRAWPGESLHARATVGLDVLATIGTDVALMHLHGVAQKLKFKGLQEKAREKIAAVAATRGFTAEELADRLVPDFDLGDEGGNVLDFGPRAFTISFDESLKPRLLGPDGKVVPDLPKPGKNDDAAKAAAATDRWKTLKKDAKTIASSQLLRLELAMCDERRWKSDVFRTFLVEHPVVVHLVRRLVWGAYDGKGKMTATFRLAEDGTFADDRDKPFTLADSARVGIVHRLGIDDATLARWSTLFGDYEILQPFDQLARQTFEATKEERTGKFVDRLGKTAVKTSRLMGLEARGWRKGAAQDGGWVWDMWRTFGDGIVATFTLEGGFCMGAADLNPTTQVIGPITFERADSKRLGLDALSPIAFSELARERESLRE